MAHLHWLATAASKVAPEASSAGMNSEYSCIPFRAYFCNGLVAVASAIASEAGLECAAVARLSWRPFFRHLLHHYLGLVLR